MAEELSLTKSMWVEAGIQFRSNLLHYVGAKIVLHEHHFDHVSMCTHGWFAVTEITKDGIVKQYQVASKGFVPTRMGIAFEPVGYRISIPAWHSHAFELLELQGQPAEMLCMFPA